MVTNKPGNTMVVLYAILVVFLVFGAPNLVAKLTDMQEKTIPAKLGGQANLTCSAITDYHDAVLSFNGRVIIEKPEKFKQLPNGALAILDIQPQDTGEYRYKQISNGSTQNHCIITLQITEETQTVKPGSTVSMTCKVPTAVKMWKEVSWRKKYPSKAVTLDKNGSVTEFAKQNFSGRISASGHGNKLTILNAEEGDSGEYTCIVVIKDIFDTREQYFINLVVSISSTIKPKTNEIMSSGKSSTSTSFPASPMSKNVTNTKGGTTRLAPYMLPVAILVLLPFVV